MRDQNEELPLKTSRECLLMVQEIPNAEEDCLRHSVQWQT